MGHPNPEKRVESLKKIGYNQNFHDNIEQECKIPVLPPGLPRLKKEMCSIYIYYIYNCMP